MIFSERYAPTIRNGKLDVELPEIVRRQLADAMASHNHTCLLVYRLPDNRGVDISDVMSEIAGALPTLYPMINLPEPAGIVTDDTRQPLIDLVTRGQGENVLDSVELMWAGLLDKSRDWFAMHVNSIFEKAELPWRMLRGECIRLDPEFVGSQVTQDAFERLAAGPFAGAAAEFAKAIREQAAGEIKDAIADACKSYESTLKVLVGNQDANAGILIDALLAQGCLDDLPEGMREGFRQVVLMGLPFMRNRLAGHGQGTEVIDVPPVYGELALRLAAALQNFVVSKFLARHPPDPPTLWQLPQCEDSQF